MRSLKEYFWTFLFDQYYHLNLRLAGYFRIYKICIIAQIFDKKLQFSYCLANCMSKVDTNLPIL
ncbi:hypothetical protein T10_580 [Trichinella papuae]|uniref:Uncharacterized protein n=1 Tax=Trichinella papuae TaxID=268474 RepID=A0A0V1N2I6_9BILA|nr:hypothetical protein T10_580 [Trichinella papuae]